MEMKKKCNIVISIVFMILILSACVKQPLEENVEEKEIGTPSIQQTEQLQEPDVIISVNEESTADEESSTNEKPSITPTIEVTQTSQAETNNQDSEIDPNILTNQDEQQNKESFFIKCINKLKQIKFLNVILIICICLCCVGYIAVNLRGKKSKTLKVNQNKCKCRLLNYGNAQHIGTRKDQQDSFGISDIDNTRIVNNKGILAVVADGMGGLENGKAASTIAVESILSQFSKEDSKKSIPQWLKAIVKTAQDNVYQSLNANGDNNSGSTVVAVIIKEFKLYWAAVGDSRIYLYRNNRLYQLTRDHIYANKLNQEVLKGDKKLLEVWNDEQKGALTSYLGNKGVNEIDYNKKPLKLLIDDRIVLCSDGIYNTINNKEMGAFLANKPHIAAQNIQYEVLAKNKTHQDNLTIIIIGVE